MTEQFDRQEQENRDQEVTVTQTPDESHLASAVLAEDSPEKTTKITPGFVRMAEKKAFRSGLLTGLLAVGCIWLLVALWQRTGAVIKQRQAGTAEVTSMAGIKAKMDLISEYIDQDFLFDVDYAEMGEYVYTGMLAGLGDPYAAYFTKEGYEQLKTSNAGSYEGIGITMRKTSEDVRPLVVAVTKGGPAEEAGILADDEILMVDKVSTEGMTISDLAALVKGVAGTQVELTFYRPSQDKEYTVLVTRRAIDTITVEAKMLAGKIGYIRITQFEGVTVTQFDAAIDQMKKEGAKALVLDVRANPGGLVSSAVSMLDTLLPEGVAVYTETKNKERYNYNLHAGEVELPMALLVDGSSASSSEIFAGALKDYGKAVLVGTTTYGKGIVQSIRPLEDGSALRMTVAYYYTPKGTCIHKIGIVPDVVVEREKEEITAFEDISEQSDAQIKKACELLYAQMK